MEPSPPETPASRRAFIASLAAITACRPTERSLTTAAPTVATVPEVARDSGGLSEHTLAAAERLFGIEYTATERRQILESIEEQVGRTLALRKLDFPNDLAPATSFDPRLPGSVPSGRGRVRLDLQDPGPLPPHDEDIAHAPVTSLSGWIARRRITSERLTELYIHRLRTLGPALECVVTITEELAREQARAADREIARGRIRGPLHGVPWGAKDLLDVADVRTTWGATPYKDRVSSSDATVVRRLADAGAVLVAKLTLGALAYGDIWFGGQTRNPWHPEEGSSGSSAGSAAATAAGLVGFSLGTETLGSIVSPCMRCGTTGLRPTFGRVPRTGAMALCWSLDKIGPICRTVADTALVLAAIAGPDHVDASAREAPLTLDLRASASKIRIGYDPTWFQGDGSSEIDRQALDAARSLGMELVEVEIPKLPWDCLLTILLAEAAAAFESLTLTDRDDELRWQERDAWPNTFRATRFVSAIELIQADRLRRRAMEAMADVFRRVDVMMSPSYAGSLLVITNFTGHPSLTLRAGFESRPPIPLFGRAASANATEDGPKVRVPRGITLWGRLFDEGTLVTLGRALEHRLDVWRERPQIRIGDVRSAGG